MSSTIADRLLSRATAAGIVVLYLIAAASVVGFGVFRARPDLLGTIPGAAAAYPRAVAFFPKAQVIGAFAVLAIYLAWKCGARWLLPFVAVYALSLSSELAGTTVGLPFGPYRYTDALGAKWFGHVPVLIPLSWFMMAVPSYALAAASDARRSRAVRVVVGAIILLAWDLSLDPAMSAATAFWVWGSAGAYYGMPWLNLFGWFVTGIVLMAALAALGADDWTRRLSTRWVAAFYGANLALSLGLAAVGGMWLAFLSTAGVLAACWFAIRTRRVESRVLA
jgi:putative membrane protein